MRSLHGRYGGGEAKLVRCASGAVHNVVVDIRPWSPTFGQCEAFRLDDVTLHSLYIPRGLLHGFQVLTGVADTCYRIDAEHDPAENIAVRWDDPELDITWPLPVSMASERDASAPAVVATARAHGGVDVRARPAQRLTGVDAGFGRLAKIPVTRIEVLDFVGELFDAGPVARETRLRGPTGTPAATRVLAQLPPGSLGSVEGLRDPFEVPEDLSKA